MHFGLGAKSQPKRDNNKCTAQRTEPKKKSEKQQKHGEKRKTKERGKWKIALRLEVCYGFYFCPPYQRLRSVMADGKGVLGWGSGKS